MSTKFAGIQIIKVGNTRRFAQPLTAVHKSYLKALKLTEQSLLSPHAAPD